MNHPVALMLVNLGKTLPDVTNDKAKRDSICWRAVKLLSYAVDQLGDAFPYAGITSNDGELWFEWFPEPHRSVSMHITTKHDDDDYLFYHDRRTDEYDLEMLTPEGLVDTLRWYLGDGADTS